MMDTVVSLKEQNENLGKLVEELVMLIHVANELGGLKVEHKESLLEVKTGLDSLYWEAAALLRDLENETEEQEEYIQTLEIKVKGGDTEKTDG